MKALNVRNGVLLCVVSNFHPKNAERINEMSRNELIQISRFCMGEFLKILQKTPFYLVQNERCASDS